MEFNVPLARSTAATGGAGTSSAGAASAACAGSSGGGNSAEDAGALMEAASFLLQAEPETVTELVRDEVSSRKLAEQLATLLPLVADVTAEEAPVRVAAALFGVPHDKATAGEAALRNAGTLLRARRKQICWSLQTAAAVGFTEHRPLDVVKLPGADEWGADDVVRALAELTCQAEETTRAQLAVAMATMESATELRQQLELAYRVVHRYDEPRMQTRLRELALREARSLSAPASAGEARFHALHAPLREARQVIAARIDPVVEEDAVLSVFAAVRPVVLDFAVAAMSPRVRGFKDLQALFETGGAAGKHFAFMGTSTSGRLLAAPAGGGKVSLKAFRDNGHGHFVIFRLDAAETPKQYQVVAWEPGAPAGAEPLVLETPIAFGYGDRGGKPDVFSIEVSHSGAVTMRSVAAMQREKHSYHAQLGSVLDSSWIPVEVSVA